MRKWGMATPLVPQTLKIDHSPGRQVERLYGGAIGPLQAAYYLPRFSRFEQSGRTGMSWNWAAALLTLNWLLFRQLWLAALGYVLALLLLPALVLGLGRAVFELPQSVEWGLWLSCAVLCVVVPGAWGNALFFGQCQRRIAQALAATATLDEACVRLLQQSSQKRRAVWLGLGNVLVWALAAWLYTGLPIVPTPVPQVAVLGLMVEAPALPAVSAPAEVASMPQQPVSEPVPGPSSAPLAPGFVYRAPVASFADKAKTVASKPSARASAAGKALGPVFVNVGLFADPDNARNAYVKLVKSDVPAVREVIRPAEGSKKEKLTRVRAGPFVSRAQAQAAVVKIKALQLDAVIAP